MGGLARKLAAGQPQSIAWARDNTPCWLLASADIRRRTSAEPGPRLSCWAPIRCSMRQRPGILPLLDSFAPPRRRGARRPSLERREDYALLLQAVGGRVALARARALRAADVGELDALGDQLGSRRAITLQAPMFFGSSWAQTIFFRFG